MISGTLVDAILERRSHSFKKRAKAREEDDAKYLTEWRMGANDSTSEDGLAREEKCDDSFHWGQNSSTVEDDDKYVTGRRSRINDSASKDGQTREGRHDDNPPWSPLV